MSRHLERILDAAGQKVDGARPILEINPDHPMVVRLAAETDPPRQQDWANLIFDQALLSEGGRLEDPAGFVRRMNELIVALAAGGGSAGEEEDRDEGGGRDTEEDGEEDCGKSAGKGTAGGAGTTSEPDTAEQDSDAERT